MPIDWDFIPIYEVGYALRESQKYVDISTALGTLTMLKRSYADWLSFSQLIHDLIGGVIQRNVFSQWELDLLLDLQVTRLGRTARADLLRRYLREVLRRQAKGDAAPPRLATFHARRRRRSPLAAAAQTA